MESFFITAFVGDAQSLVSPDACNKKVAIIARYDARLTMQFKHISHTMRYSELTGACINCVTFNNFVGQAVHGVTFPMLFNKELEATMAKTPSYAQVSRIVSLKPCATLVVEAVSEAGGWVGAVSAVVSAVGGWSCERH
jgi:hypothetical protein